MASTDRRVNRAISYCKAMSGDKLGCSADLTTVRGGRNLGIACSRENMIIADGELAQDEY